MSVTELNRCRKDGTVSDMDLLNSDGCGKTMDLKQSKEIPGKLEDICEG